mgnify:CR=1 FL=1
MFEFDGYAIIPGLDVFGEAKVVMKDRITKTDLIKWGWYVDILTRYKSYDYWYWFGGKEEMENGKAFEYQGKYYTFSGKSNATCPFNGTFWQGGQVTNSDFEDMINLALSAPMDGPVEECKAEITTVDGKKFPFTLWTSPPLNGRRPFTSTIKGAPVPGISFDRAVKKVDFVDYYDGYGGYPEKYFLEKYGNNMYREWVRDGRARTMFTLDVMPFRRFTAHFPNCEVTPYLCVGFVYVTALNGDLITSVGLKVSEIHHTTNIRRIPMPRYQPRTTTDAISCYVMTRPMVQSLINNLYTTDVYERVKQMLYGDGAGNLLSLKWFYGVRPSVATTRQAKVTLGNVVLNNVVAPVYKGDFVQVYMGYINVTREYGDFRDYTNVRYQAYIPMVGVIDLDPAQVVGKDLHLVYTVNLTDGSAVVTLAVSNLQVGGKPALSQTDGWYVTPQIVFSSSITYGYEIPLNVDSIRSPALLVGDVVSKAVFGGVAGALAGNYAGAALGAMGGAVAGAATGVETTYSVGSLTANSNVMGDFTPKLIRTITKDVSGDISQAVGLPCGKVLQVGNVTGYLKAAMVYGTPSTTTQHTDEIVNMLKEGIYIS